MHVMPMHASTVAAALTFARKCLQVHKAKLLNAGRWANSPKDGIVAVKVQYPGALEIMVQDLSNIRLAAGFLQVPILLE